MTNVTALVEKLQTECKRLRKVVESAESVLDYAMSSDCLLRCKNCEQFLIEGGDNFSCCVGCDKCLCNSCSYEAAVANKSDTERESECINCYGEICIDCSNNEIGCKYC